MQCPRCGDNNDGHDAGTRVHAGEDRDAPGGKLVRAGDARISSPWCRDCENQYDAWVRQYAADIIWQTGLGAIVAMIIGLGLPLLGLEPIIGIVGVLIGFGTFIGLRQWGKARRRRQFLADGLPRAYLPSKT